MDDNCMCMECKQVLRVTNGVSMKWCGHCGRIGHVSYPTPEMPTIVEKTLANIVRLREQEINVLKAHLVSVRTQLEKMKKEIDVSRTLSLELQDTKENNRQLENALLSCDDQIEWWRNEFGDHVKCDCCGKQGGGIDCNVDIQFHNKRKCYECVYKLST